MTTFPSRWRSAGLALIPALLVAGCSSSSSKTEVTVTGVSVSPRPASVTVGETVQLTARATLSDGSTQNVTADAAWISSTTSVATVSGGLVTGVAPGTSRVTATYQGRSAFSDVTVNAVPPTLLSIAVTPDPATVSSGATIQLAVTGTFSSGPPQDLTAEASFVSSVTSVATVSSTGLVTGVSAGTSTITATARSMSARREVTVTEAVPPAAEQIVFWNGYGSGVSFRDFGGSTNPNVAVDASETFQGRSVLRFEITGSGGYSGGAWVSSTPRDLSAYDALTFWVKASTAGTLNVTGFGNESGAGIGTEYPTERTALPLTTAWQKYTIPIPNPAKLANVAGLFHLADAPDGYVLFLADVIYEHLGAGVLGTAAAEINLAGASPTIPEGSRSTLNPGQNRVVYPAVTGDPANPVTLNPVANRFFTFTSANPAVATVDADGVVTGVTAGGPVAITATLAGAAASGAYDVTVTSVLATPTVPPPVPTHAATAVKAFYSSVTGGYAGTDADYAGSIDTWRTCWSPAGATGGDPIATPISSGGISASPRKYVLGAGGDSYVGIELLGKTGATQPGSCGGTVTGVNELDASAMDHLHIDLWSPDVDLSSNFQIKLVDAGPDGQVANTDPWAIYQANGPALARGTWLSLDFALSSPVAGALSSRAHIAQIVLQSPGGGTFYVDNFYLYATPAAAAPSTAAAAPTALPANVMSLLSATYTGGPSGGDYSGHVDSYQATCFGPAGPSVADYAIPSAHTVKKYTLPASTFAIIELIGATGGTATPPDSALCGGGTQTGANLLDTTGMTRLHLDVWSPGGSTNFQVHLVNVDSESLDGPGQTATHSGGTNHATGAKTIAAGTWTSLDLDLSGDFGPPGAPARLGLVKLFTSDAGEFYLDNVYFYRPAAFAPLTFDDAAVTYTATGFGGAYGFPAPDPAGPTSVMALVKTAGAETWAGVTISTGAGLTVAPIPFTASKKTLTMKVYSPAAGVPFLMKLENPADGTAVVEKQAVTVGANAWETLTFDFAAPSAGAVDLAKTYDKLSVFPGFGTAGGVADTTYYVDDIAFAP